MEKHSVSRLSYLFAHLYLLSSYSFSSDLLSSNLPLLSASALLCFSSLHIVGSLTSKLPSMMSRAVVGLQNLLSPAEPKPPNAVIVSRQVLLAKEAQCQKKRPPNGSPNLHKDVRDDATYV